MIKSVIVNPSGGNSLSIGDCPAGDTLLTARYGEIYGSFKTLIIAGATTETVVTPYGDEAIVLTDIITSLEKKNACIVTLKFSGGGSTEVVFRADVSDLPYNIGMPFTGRWQGWQAAKLKLTNSLALSGSVSVGYYRIPKARALPHDEWEARR